MTASSTLVVVSVLKCLEMGLDSVCETLSQTAGLKRTDSIKVKPHER